MGIFRKDDSDTFLRDRFENQRKNEEKLKEKIENKYIPPSEEEVRLAEELVGKTTKRFSGELLNRKIEDIEGRIREFVINEAEELPLPKESRLKVSQTALLTLLGRGPIERYLEDPDITEVIVQRYDNVVYEKKGKIYKADAVFTGEEQLRTVINRIVQKVNKQVNIATPIVDARLPDGSRVNATFPPVSPDGATLDIRKFNMANITGEDYIEMGSMSRGMLEFLKKCVKGKITIFVSGGTGTGKTTMLNMLSAYIPDDELIVTIEDTIELKLQQPNVRRMEVRRSDPETKMMDVDTNLLVKNALRQRPDRIILGESRDGSVVDLISAMSTGHEGSMSTIHANSPENMVNIRMPILYSMNKEADFSENSIALQISEAVDIVVQLSRMPDGSRKVTEISEVTGAEGSRVRLQPIFKYDIKTGKFGKTGNVPKKTLRKLALRGVITGMTDDTDTTKKGESNEDTD